MNIQYKHPQFELFSQNTTGQEDATSSRGMSLQLALTLENLVILFIASIMVMIFCFSLGVERGKRVAFADPARYATVATKVTEQTPAQQDGDPQVEGAAPAQKPSRSLFGGVLAFFKGKSKEAAPAIEVKYEEVAEEDGVDLEATAEVKTVAELEAQESVVPTGGYTVQLASYKGRRSAEREAEALKKKGYEDIYVLDKNPYIILCVGNFISRSDAMAYTNRFGSRYGKTLVRKL